ncbi:hypothetical protein MYX07_07115 [Patescibacteria group bacterium AH-259-L07]|nr:hypothetical protein [Patescibacteria group bacterium AH-259-L07]
MGQLKWLCNACKKHGVVEIEDLFNPYIEGYKVYKQHEEQSSNCPNPFVTVEIKKTHQVLLNDTIMQTEFRQITRLGGRVETIDDKVIIYRGIIPVDVIETLAGRIKKFDTENLLVVSIKYKE